MSLKKRLRVILAALTQDWREETCPDCGDRWFSQAVSLPSQVWCAYCEEKQRMKWERDYFARRYKGAAQ